MTKEQIETLLSCTSIIFHGIQKGIIEGKSMEQIHKEATDTINFDVDVIHSFKKLVAESLSANKVNSSLILTKLCSFPAMKEVFSLDKLTINEQFGLYMAIQFARYYGQQETLKAIEAQ